jgi:hypothetical protein
MNALFHSLPSISLVMYGWCSFICLLEGMSFECYLSGITTSTCHAHSIDSASLFTFYIFRVWLRLCYRYFETYVTSIGILFVGYV